MWVWLKLKLTPKGDFCVVSVKAFFVNLFMHSPKQYLNGKYSDFPFQTPQMRPKSAIYTPN